LPLHQLHPQQNNICSCSRQAPNDIFFSSTPTDKLHTAPLVISVSLSSQHQEIILRNNVLPTHIIPAAFPRN
jgi:hypothetical protein